jgi:3-oxoacyl-[acyl-carrier protein] reductase
MRIIKKLNKLHQAIKGAKAIYRVGGVASVNIAYPRYNAILQGKNILITGGGSGIGLSIAKKCVACGAHVVITGRNTDKLEKAKVEIDQVHCSSIVWDIASIDKVEHKLEECQTLLNGEIDVLINNAGVPPSKFWGNVDEEEWDMVYSTNLKGLYFLTQTLVNRWKRQPVDEYRKIINISSQGGFVGATYPYRMVKWDVRGLTEGLGKTLIKDKIIVNGIAPGVVKTAMQSFSNNQGDNLYTNQNPIKRVILPEEIAELALFLISDASNAIVGQTIVCDGGYILK